MISKERLKKYTDFLKLFKQLRTLYQENWGDSPNLPGPFTEDLVATLYDLQKSTDNSTLGIKAKGNDLSDSEGNEYEVKATTSSNGTTTVKNSEIKFHKMLWIYCDFDKEELTVKAIDFDDYKKAFDEIRKGKTSERITMNLSKLAIESEQVFSMETLEKNN